MPKALLLDVMGTLVTEPFFEHLPRFLGMTLEELVRAKHPSSWVEFEHGHCDERAYVARFFADGRPIDGSGLKRVMWDSYQFIEGIELLLGDLTQVGIPMHALSNYPRWYEMIEQKLHLSRFLRWSFVSCLTGVRKPDPEAYLGSARALALSPAECLFVDDRRANCAAAESLGMPAVHFESAAQLRSELRARRVLE